MRYVCVWAAAGLLGLSAAVGAEANDADLAPLVALVAESDDASLQRDILAGIREGLRGRKQVPMPEGWSAAYARLAKSGDAAVREHALALALTFGDPQAVGQLQRTMLDASAPADERRRAMQALAESRATDLAPTLHQLLSDSDVRGHTIRALAAYPHPRTPALLLDLYPKLSDEEKQDVVLTLASRVDFAQALLDGLEKKIIPPADISAYTARQLQNLNDEAVSGRLKKLWGEVRSTSGVKRELIGKYKRLLTPEFLDEGDPRNGRLVYNRTCLKCHRLYGDGGEIGPDLTGSNRANLDYVLENSVDPSAVIPGDYRMSTAITADGRVLTGIITVDAPEAIVMQTVNEKLVISREDIEELRPSPLSMMPEGQLEALEPEEVRDLVVYLRSETQVELPEGDGNP